jgi:hypothetical protein
VETSGDLVHWNGPVATAEEIASGSYRSALGPLEASPHFFRIRPTQ